MNEYLNYLKFQLNDIVTCDQYLTYGTNFTQIKTDNQTKTNTFKNIISLVETKYVVHHIEFYSDFSGELCD